MSIVKFEVAMGNFDRIREFCPTYESATIEQIEAYEAYYEYLHETTYEEYVERVMKITEVMNKAFYGKVTFPAIGVGGASVPSMKVRKMREIITILEAELLRIMTIVRDVYGTEAHDSLYETHKLLYKNKEIEEWWTTVKWDRMPEYKKKELIAAAHQEAIFMNRRYDLEQDFNRRFNEIPEELMDFIGNNIERIALLYRNKTAKEEQDE